MSKKILIISPSWVGDIVMSQSLLKRIKLMHADTQIDVIAPAYSRSLFSRMPEVNQVIHAPFGHGDLKLSARYQLGKSLRQQYDQAFILPNSFKSALIPWFARIPLRTGWRGEMRYGLINDMRLLSPKHYPKMVQRYLALGFEPNEPFDDEAFWPKLHPDENAIKTLKEKFNITQDKPILVLCPGAAYGPSKRWPEQNFIALAQHFSALGWSTWSIAGPKEKAVPQTLDLTQTSLAEAIDLMSLATVVVSNDSGMMHIASALSKPVVAIYGATLPEFAPPLSHHARILSLTLNCKPCFKRECPLGHYQCLQKISVEEVIQSILSL